MELRQRLRPHVLLTPTILRRDILSSTRTSTNLSNSMERTPMPALTHRRRVQLVAPRLLHRSTTRLLGDDELTNLRPPEQTHQGQQPDGPCDGSKGVHTPHGKRPQRRIQDIHATTAD